MLRMWAALVVSTLGILLASSALAQPYRVGANLLGTVVDLPEVETSTGETVRRGVPTVVVFVQVKNCSLCSATGYIVRSWIERYPNVQVVSVDTRSAKQAVEEWGREYGVPVIHDAVDKFEDAFDTNLVHAYLLNEQGVVVDRVRPLYREQWLALDHQLARANVGDWQAVADHVASLPVIGGVARSLPSVPLGTGRPTIVLSSDGFCYWCRELAAGMARPINGYLEERPDVSVYLLEPSIDSIASGFYGTETHDYGAREVYEEFADLYGEEAAGAEIMKYLNTGEVTGSLPNQLWPDTGLTGNVTVVRYEVGGPDDPTVAWGYGTKDMGVAVFDGDGRYLGPVPLFLGDSARELVTTFRRLLPVD